jgi:hypothetical protein
MIRVALILTIAYFSVGYALDNSNQAAYLHRTTSSVVSALYDKASTLISGQQKKEVLMPEQAVTIHP